ncbi:MAG: hypothetical protein JRI68_30270 [Deltaproteobacteria bacterium]|nr:hypothetical protein [Deltaproteobacteria bacterium]
MVDQDTEAPGSLPKDAATVIVARQREATPETAGPGIEVFCVRRHAQSAFLGGVVVFPGGKLDAADAGADLQERTNGVHPRASAFAESAEHALGLAICACRESLEEAELLPCLAPLTAAEVGALRERLTDSARHPVALGPSQGEPPFAALLRDQDLQLDTAALVPFARWITPAGERRRFDTRFYLTPLPPGQAGRHDQHETVSSLWASPTQLLSAYTAGDLFLAPPTIRTLALLSTCANLEAATALCAAQSLEPVCPEFVPGDPPMLALPGDPNHSVAERRVAGPTRFVVRDGLFVAEDP